MTGEGAFGKSFENKAIPSRYVVRLYLKNHTPLGLVSVNETIKRRAAKTVGEEYRHSVETDIRFAENKLGLE